MIKKNNKGYSMIALIIAIIVVLILAGVSITSLSTTRERTEIMNFIYDLNSISDKVQNYYIETGTLPTSSSEAIDIYELADIIGANAGMSQRDEFLSQLSQYDSDKYYVIDLNQLKGLSLKESYRGIQSLKDANIQDNGYIVNEGSLKVYVEKGVKYKAKGDNEGSTYYTLTSRLVNGQETYTSLEEDIVIVGNPQEWVKDAGLRVVLPKRSLTEEEWDRWIFRWDLGPKTQEEMESIPDTDTRRNFKYGEKLVVKSNGIYTIYVKEPDTGTVTLKKVNVTKIDDKSPSSVFIDDGWAINTFDNETGIKFIKFKTLNEYRANVAQAQSEAESGGDPNAEARNKVDYFLMDGYGSDVIYEFEGIINDYVAKKNEIKAAMEEEYITYSRWENEHPVDGIIVLQAEADAKKAAHLAYIADYNRALEELKKKYAYLEDVEGTTDDSRLVIYIEDYAGNGFVFGDNDVISTIILAKSFSISLEALLPVE